MTSTPDPSCGVAQRPGLLRRMGALFYDVLLLAAVLFLAAAVVLPLTGGEAVKPYNPLFSAYLFMVCLLYFAWPWVRGGQTLGMKTWRLRAQRVDGGTLTWRNAVLRFLVALASWAPLGAGFLWVLVDKDKMAWHDRLSKTVLVMEPKTGQN